MRFLFLLGIVAVEICSVWGEAPKLIQRFRPENPISSFVYSPDGKFFAVGGHNAIRIFDATTHELVSEPAVMSDEEQATLAAHGGGLSSTVKTLAFSHDSSLLAAGLSTGQVKMFDTGTGIEKLALDGVDRTLKPLHPFLDLRLAQGRIWQIACSPDGKWVATCGEPIDHKRDGVMSTAIVRRGLVRSWDAKTGKIKHGFGDLMSIQIFNVAFSPDGKYLAIVGGWLKGVVKLGNGALLCDAQSGAIVRELQIPVEQTVGTNPFAVRFFPDGKRVALGVVHPKEARKLRGSIYVFDTESAELKVAWDVARAVNHLDVSRDGQFIAAMAESNHVTLYDAASGNAVHELKPVGNPTATRWSTFAFSPAQDVLAISGTDASKRPWIEFWGW